MKGWIGSGIAAGIALFLWGAIAHMALPLGEMGIKSMPEEVTAVLGERIKTPGVYFFPSVGAGTEQEMEKTSQAYATQPHGLMAFTPTDGKPYSMAMPLTIQFVIDLICGVILAWLIWQAWLSLPGLGAKVGFAAVVGFLASFAVSAPYCNWYGFGGAFFIGQMIESIVGFSIGGAVIGWLMRR